ncbi:hypothetical protein BH10ACI2_BH10ACI2_00660 [soil metagenome]
MADNRKLFTVVISAFVGGTIAVVTCLAFFFYFKKPAQTVDTRPSPGSPPAATPIQEIPNPDIKPDDVRSVTINTVYKGYFAAGDKCSKNYNEYFGNEDGIASSSSPCTVTIKFDRSGNASRSVVISRWDKTMKEKHVVEKNDWTAQITSDQFNEIANSIVTNQAFKSWRDGTMITVSNCTISVTHSGGTRSPMSNVDEKTTAYLPIVEAFKHLEKQLNWKSNK